MRRLLIVDDEILVRVGLRALVDWTAEGYQIVGEAASGDEAASLLASLDPDIVLTDLVMGPGDGFSLIEAARARSESTGIVVLSCRNDFDAVREAMRRGADDYLFKPTMRREEILSVLARVCAKRLAPNAALGLAPNASPWGERRREEESLPPLSLYAAGWELPAADIESCLAEAGIEGGFLGAYRASLFALRPDASGEEADRSSSEAFAQAVRELRRRELSEFRAFPYAEGRVLVLSRGAYRDAAREIWAGIDEYARRYFGRPADGGTSAPAEGLPSLPRAAAEAGESLAYRFFAGGGLRFAEELPPKVERGLDSALRIEQAFKSAARCLDRSAMDSALVELVSGFRAACGPAPDRLREAIWDFLSPLRERARSARVEIDDPLEAGGCSPHLAFLRGPDLGALEALARSYASRAADRISGSLASRCRPEILRVVDAVREDLSRNYSIEAAAALATMSPSHFEHVFKREIGDSFVRFVTKAKMERALELLADEGLKVYEIASSLGYENANYFSTIFKQITGLTPQEARNSEGRSGIPEAERPPRQDVGE